MLSMGIPVYRDAHQSCRGESIKADEGQRVALLTNIGHLNGSDCLATRGIDASVRLDVLCPMERCARRLGCATIRAASKRKVGG